MSDTGGEYLLTGAVAEPDRCAPGARVGVPEVVLDRVSIAL